MQLPGEIGQVSLKKVDVIVSWTIYSRFCFKGGNKHEFKVVRC